MSTLFQEIQTLNQSRELKDESRKTDYFIDIRYEFDAPKFFNFLSEAEYINEYMLF